MLNLADLADPAESGKPVANATPKLGTPKLGTPKLDGDSHRLISSLTERSWKHPSGDRRRLQSSTLSNHEWTGVSLQHVD